jgi:hypothetical protein
MAGLALYGDLVPVLAGNQPIAPLYRLESVRILPPAAGPPNSPDLYGAITGEAIARAEVQAPQRRRAVDAAFQRPDNMRVIEVATPQAKPGVRSIPLLERSADSAGVPFDRMIHRAKVPPSAMRFCCRARVVEEPSAPR